MKLIGIKGYRIHISLYLLCYLLPVLTLLFLTSYKKSSLCFIRDIFSGDRGEMSTANTADSLPEDYRVFNFERPEERDR